METQTILKGIIVVKYVQSGLSKKNKPYCMVSDGLNSYFMNVECPLDDFEGLKKHDLVELEVEVDAFDSFNKRVVGVEAIDRD